MGLDQYIFTTAKDNVTKLYENPDVSKLFYWRKHPNLHGAMKQLWVNKGMPTEPGDDISMFNGIKLYLTWEDIEWLESLIKEHKLPSTTGFFFGDNVDNYYYEKDLEFIKLAKAELFLGLKIFYYSSW